MFVYFHWSKAGHQHVQAFHKADKAAEYVIGQIETLAIDEGRNLGLRAKKKEARAYPNHNHNQVDQADLGDEMPFAPVVNAAAPVVNHGIDWGHWGDQPVAIPPPPTDKKEVKGTNKIPPELLKLRDHMEIAKKDKTFDNALKAIQLYEDFLKYGLSTPCDSSIHTLTDLKIVE